MRTVAANVPSSRTLDGARIEPLQSVADVDAAPVGVDVAEAHEEVGVVE